jgi:hypothetical protein
MPVEPPFHTDRVTPHVDTTRPGHTDTVVTPHVDTPPVHSDSSKIHTDVRGTHIDVVTRPPEEQKK